MIFQHPQEPKEPLSSVPVVLKVLPDALIRVGLSVPNLNAALKGASFKAESDPKAWAVLYFGSGIKSNLKSAPKPGLYEVDKKGELQNDPGLRLPFSGNSRKIKGLVLIDGTWSQAKTLWWRNAWLTRLRRLILIPEKPSLYGSLRREPRKETLSTLESLAYTLSSFGEDKAVEEGLISAFGEHLKALRKPPAKPATSSTS